MGTEEQILLTAERLIAEHGVAGVSLRQIGAAAGQKNNSAVQYHFGTKTELIRAIYRYRIPALNERRLEMLDALKKDTLRDLIRIDVLPFAELSESSGGPYIEFLARMFLDAEFEVMLQREEEEPELMSGVREIRKRIRPLLPKVPTPVLSYRFWYASTHCIFGLAERRRAKAKLGARWVSPLDAYVANYVDYAVAGLSAPVTKETLRLARTMKRPGRRPRKAKKKKAASRRSR